MNSLTRNVKQWLVVAAIVFVHIFSIQANAGLESLPVQDGGRIKPFDTFAREMLSLLYGKESYNKLAAEEVVLSWLLVPQEWEEAPFVLVRHSGLREAMNLDNKRLYYSVKELMLNDRLGLLVQDLKNKRDAQEKLDPFYQAVQTLENQISSFQAIKLGLGLRIMPKEGDAHTWSNLTELQGEPQEKFKAITTAFVKVAQASSQKDRAAEKSARAELNSSVDNFVAHVNSRFGDYAHSLKIKAEVHYNHFHPFRWAWVFYFLSLIFFSFAYFGTKSSWMNTGWWLMAAGFLFHTWGFALRVYILERAPVTNMFETVIWVAWGALIFAKILYKFTGAKILPVAAAMVATLSLILCDVSSSVLDDSLIPLEPVLRDNFWLLTHVVIIVSSYAAFFLAFFIGDVMLYYFMKDEKRFHDKIQSGTLAIYRCIQIGVVLLAAGVILGGVWADYSWGRFWGWDPKETWAFIALLGYIAILHGRLVGWLKNFGLAASAVVSFSLVIMAWYGVNFVLGAGLHTYGFGAGGVEYVSAFVAVHLLFVAYVTTLRQSRLKGSKT
jgi:ABC-type transport system involved in cytochrome c biogenesis permease subunit